MVALAVKKKSFEGSNELSTQLIIDLDSLTQEKARSLAGMILALTGYEEGDTPIAETPKALVINQESIGINVPQTFDPAAAFGSPAPQGVISQAGPSLVIPNPPSAPVAPAADVTSTTLDKSGLPWDARIHASSKTMNADGTWRLRRGADKAEVDRVTAELQKLMAIPAPAASGPQLVPAPPIQIPPAVVNTAIAPIPPPPAADATSNRQQFVDLIGRASKAVGEGKVSQDQINVCLRGLGLENLPSLGIRLDLVPAACQLIDAIIAGQSA